MHNGTRLNGAVMHNGTRLNGAMMHNGARLNARLSQCSAGFWNQMRGDMLSA